MKVADNDPDSEEAGAAQDSPLSLEDGVRQLQEAHSGVLLTYLTRMTRGDVHRAEDILQETVVRAWRHPEARAGHSGWKRAWLFTVARRIAIDQMRVVPVQPSDQLEEQPLIDDRFDRAIDRGEIRAALSSMPDRFRDVLIEIYFKDRSVAEAARRLGVPEGTIKSRTFYALRAMRSALRQRGFVDSGHH